MSLYTFLSKSPTALIKRITTSHLSNAKAKESVLLFTLSANAPTTAYVPILESIARSAKHSVGCLSHPLPSFPPDVIACSFAFFDQATCLPFRSIIKGREAIGVGRNRPPISDESSRNFPKINDLPSTTQIDWKDVWKRGTSEEQLPEDLRKIHPESIKAVVYLSSAAHEGLSDALASHLPNAMRLGLLASSTPFVTGRPSTLFYGNDIYSDGAVGLVLAPDNTPCAVTTSFPALHRLTLPLEVTESEGNLIISLDNANPTQLLLSALQKEGMQVDRIKEDDFYLGEVAEDLQPNKVYQVTSGDPSRGTLSLDSDYAPEDGTKVCLYRHRDSRQQDSISHDFPGALNFLVASPDIAGHAVLDADVSVLQTSISASENGWVLGRGQGEQPWKCTVVDGCASLSINQSRDNDIRK